MTEQLIKWNVYEVSAESTVITGAMFRGRIRKFGLENNVNVLVDNSEDVKNRVRFAVINEGAYQQIASYIKTIAPDALIELCLENVSNPVLGKLKVNIESRYEL